MRKISISALVLLFSATSPLSADTLEEELTKFVGAAFQYIAAGYQLSYINQTECRRYSYKDTAAAFDISKNDVGKMFHGSMFNELIESIEPMHSQLRKEIDEKIEEPTAFQCGFAEGFASKSFKKYQNNWHLAVIRFNQAKQEQRLAK